MGGRARSTPLTVIVPVPGWWARWLRLMFLRARIGRRLTGRPPLGSLAVAAIGFAHWALVERIPAQADRREARPLPHTYLVFQSNFGGRRDAYIETFCHVIPWIMRGLWSGIYRAPSIRPVGTFQRYVADMDLPPAHYWSAYPDASTRMIVSALERRGQATPPGVRDGFCALMPVRPGRLGTLVAELSRLPEGEGSPFAGVAGTHFGRFVVVPSLMDAAGRPAGADAYVLLSTEFDGELEEHLDRLCARLAQEPLWESCAGAPRDPAALRAHLLAHRVPPGYSYAGYPDATVEQVRDAVGAA